MKRIRHRQIARQICRRIAATLFAFAAVLSPFAARAEKANVFFIHGANVSEQDARAWAAVREVGRASHIAANSMRIFGMEASKMTQVTDILTATANGSAQTLTDLFEGLKMAGPQAAAAGKTLDELCAALGVMANMGVKGSLAGTALRKASGSRAVRNANERSEVAARRRADVMRGIACCRHG